MVLLSFIGCNQKDRIINSYVNGKKEGVHFQLDSIGRLVIATYHENLLNGEYLLYHEGNKRIMRKEIYKNDRENGQAYYFYSNGSIQAQREWKNGRKIGYGVDYYATGEIEAELHYNDEGFLVLRYTYDKYGKKINEEYANGK